MVLGIFISITSERKEKVFQENRNCWERLGCSFRLLGIDLKIPNTIISIMLITMVYWTFFDTNCVIIVYRVLWRFGIKLNVIQCYTTIAVDQLYFDFVQRLPDGACLIDYP